MFKQARFSKTLSKMYQEVCLKSRNVGRKIRTAETFINGFNDLKSTRIRRTLINKRR